MRAAHVTGVGAALALVLAPIATATAVTADPTDTGKGRIALCVTGGGPLSVFADGPSLRTAKLTKECKSFRVLAGQYYVGIQGFEVPDDCDLDSVVVKRGKTSYRAPEVLFTHVTPGRTTKVTFALGCGPQVP